MSEWDFLTLEKAGVRLLDCVHKTPSAQATGLPYVAIPQLHEGEIELSDARRISAADFEEWTKKTDPQPFDMVLSRRCNPGETAYVRPGMRFALGQNLVLLRSDGTRVRAPFLRWMVRTPYWWTEINKFLNVGAVFDSLRCADVPKFSLPIPPLRHQDAICSLLGALDDKIALNRRMNKTLDAMARAIFKDWFVDFGPVRAKAERRQPYLAKETWALFPNTLDPQDRPTGWDERAVYGIAEFVNGAAYKDMHFSPERDGLPVIKIVELKNGVTASTKFTTTDLGSKYKIDTKEILFSWSGNPDTSIDTFVWVGGEAWLNQHIFRARENGSATRAMIYFQLKQLKPVFAEIARNKQTTGLGHVTGADMKALKVCAPPPAVANAYEKIVGPAFERICSNLLENRTLEKLRDLLLPKLMSGEIRLREAEELVKKVS